VIALVTARIKADCRAPASNNELRERRGTNDPIISGLEDRRGHFRLLLLARVIARLDRTVFPLLFPDNVQIAFVYVTETSGRPSRVAADSCGFFHRELCVKSIKRIVKFRSDRSAWTMKSTFPNAASRRAISELRAKILEQQSNRLVALVFARLDRRIFIRLSF